METVACDVPGCQVQVRHEHRQARFDITTGTLWVESFQQDQALTNEARAVHGLPQLVYGDGATTKPIYQFAWSSEGGLEAVPPPVVEPAP